MRDLKRFPCLLRDNCPAFDEKNECKDCTNYIPDTKFAAYRIIKKLKQYGFEPILADDILDKELENKIIGSG